MKITTIIMSFILIMSPCLAETKAKWATSNYDANVKFMYVNDSNAPRWYIGSCFGDMTPSYDRYTKLKRVVHYSPGVRKVRKETQKYRADKVFCIK